VLEELDLDPLRDCLSTLPLRAGKNLDSRLVDVRREMKATLDQVWRFALTRTKVSIPLLILDEAHHVKNDNLLSSLFTTREAVSDAEALRGPLADVFDRMLFLTATPFQLGHRELLSVLGRFEGVNDTHDAKRQFKEHVVALGRALDVAQASAMRLDRAWGRVTVEDVACMEGHWGNGDQPPLSDELSDTPRAVMIQANETCNALAVVKGLMAPLVIRHTKPRLRTYRPGDEIVPGTTRPTDVQGLDISGDNVLPFLLAARAQALISLTGLRNQSSTRAWFADGLASSFEAYLQTRAKSLAVDDLGVPTDNEPLPPQLAWYLDRIGHALPRGDETRYADHPKVAATTARLLDLWSRGEKTLVFCFYRETGRALRAHFSRALLREIADLGSRSLGGDPAEPMTVIEQIERRASSLLDTDSVGARTVQAHVGTLSATHGLDAPDSEHFAEVVLRFMRTPSFLVRCVDLTTTDPRVSIENAFAATDGSGTSLEERLTSFARQIVNLTEVERAALWEALLGVQTGSISTLPADMFDVAEGGDRRQGTLPNVRLANGEVRRETRFRLMQTFNTPFFPEVLIASSVMAEGVDLHLECRHVIHHDLDWNPSTLEQRTGRVDRLGSKATRVGRRIEVFEPFVAGTQDEKQYRVVKDREAWFQVVMGGRNASGEAETDRVAARVPMPAELANLLSLDLSVS